jgi:NTP pyrophosphatase (non-canonical NTP hydrolase)
MSKKVNMILELPQALINDLKKKANDRGITISELIEIILGEMMDKKYFGEVLEICDNGDAIIELPDDLMNDTGWEIGDQLSIDEKDGVIFMGNLTKNPKDKNVMQQDVNRFIDACDQQSTYDNMILYQNLITEEYHEFRDAVAANDVVEQLDACMDMIWVILGYCKMKGFDVAGAWAEVARSNLSKIDPKTNKVIKREDGKVLKPEGWKPPELGKYIN